ncbi:hypothetical protein KHA80_16965 [Anaerobacillus sp. HL2]|nr:hypothetical protein KHA80_16965 [Anaerobacillus sp. HL2]
MMKLKKAYPTQGKEKEWGRLIGHTIANGINTSDDCQRFQKLEPLSLKTIMVRIEQLPITDPIAKNVLEEAILRQKREVKKALQLRMPIHQKKTPILPPLLSIENARQVFSFYFGFQVINSTERL